MKNPLLKLLITLTKPGDLFLPGKQPLRNIVTFHLVDIKIADL